MKFGLLLLESRLTPAFDLGDGLVASHGATFQPFLDWTGPLNVEESGSDLFVGAGQGGGPRLGHFDLSGNRREADRFVGDPNSRQGLVPLVVSPTVNPKNAVGVPYDLSLLGVRLIASNSPPPPESWNALRDQLTHLPAPLVQTYLKAGVTLDVTYGVALTADPMFLDLRGVRVDKYGADSTTTFDGIGGLTLGQNAAIRLDELGLTGTVALHELGHAVDYTIGHWASSLPAWQTIWKSESWPADYFRLNPEEAWAESFARYYAGLPQPAAVKAYFDTTFQVMLSSFPH